MLMSVSGTCKIHVDIGAATLPLPSMLHLLYM